LFEIKVNQLRIKYSLFIKFVSMNNSNLAISDPFQKTGHRHINQHIELKKIKNINILMKQLST